MNKKAFSWVEVLVVMAIIMTLVALIVLTFQKAKLKEIEPPRTVLEIADQNGVSVNVVTVDGFDYIVVHRNDRRGGIAICPKIPKPE